ncbi:MAG: glycoside hydrolase family 5 protein [bacterium]|nr:glycoside hydrolase family 5 protein [bacterium]
MKRIACMWMFPALCLCLCLGCGEKEPAQEVPETPAQPVDTVQEEPAPAPPAAPEPAPEPAPAPTPVRAPEPAPTPGKFVTVNDGRFLDTEGRHILFHGMSVISKDPQANYQSWHGPDEFALMRKWGMNCIRLGVIWDGLEPEPGKFDEEYLKKVDQRIQWAADNDLYVFIDMHQDLYSVLYSDGAPEWATLTDGKPHVGGGDVWSDAYFTSPAIQTAFDNFWANKPCADGIGVQDHFAMAWQHIAKRYADNPTVMGYDLFNEPNLGSKNPEAQLASIVEFAKVVAKKDGTGEPDVGATIEQWLDTAGRAKLMERLKEMDVYLPVIDASASIFQEFERTLMTAMFQRVRDAIRQVDPDHIILLETSMSANMGIRSGVQPVLGPDGKPDPRQAYAPHGYDIVVDTPDLALASNDRVELIFKRHGEKTAELGMPMIIGEWGAFGGAGPDIVPSARFVVRQFEKLLCGDTYWEFGKYVLDASYFHILCRPVPVQIAGTLTAYQADFDTGAFTCSWTEDPAVTAPSRVFLTAKAFPSKEAVTLNPAGAGFEVEPADDSGNVYLTIAPTGEAVERTLTVTPPQ